jgi:predicted permease
MLDVFLRTVPFFAVIGLGYLAGRSRFFPEEATYWLTRFVFFFALSAMLFKFAASLPLAEVFDLNLATGYLLGTLVLYAVATGVAMIRRLNMAETAVEAQCAVIGNIGFLGLPMFVLLFGDAAIGPIMVMLAVDLIVFSSLIVVLISLSRDGRVSWGVLRTVIRGLLQNPMILSISAGLLWSGMSLTMPTPMEEFVTVLAGAATPGALFAIGATLASKSAERIEVASWLSFSKLVLHPIAVAIGVLVLFPSDPFAAKIVVASAACPVAGNIFMLARHYGVAPQRVSAAILLSTILSIATLPLVISLLF